MKNNKLKLLCAAFTAAILLSFNAANAQTDSKSKLRFGIGADALLPVGNISNALNFGLGLTPRLQYGLTDNVALTFTSGIYHFFGKSVVIPASGGFPSYTYKAKSDIVPVKFGAKFFTGSNIYLAAEAGAGFQVADGGGPVHFIAAPSVGYANKKWDIGLRYENLTSVSYGNGAIGLRVAYGFGL